MLSVDRPPTVRVNVLIFIKRIFHPYYTAFFFFCVVRSVILEVSLGEIKCLLTWCFFSVVAVVVVAEAIFSSSINTLETTLKFH